MEGKILVLEALGGDVFAVKAYLAQLALMGVFDQVAGIVLGTFDQLTRQEGRREIVYELLLPWISPALPVAMTPMIGHGRDSRAVLIGGRMTLERGREVTYG